MFSSMGVGREGKAPWILKLLAKKVVFSISRGKKQILSLLAPPGKNLGKTPYCLPPWKKSFRRPCFLVRLGSTWMKAHRVTTVYEMFVSCQSFQASPNFQQKFFFQFPTKGCLLTRIFTNFLAVQDYVRKSIPQKLFLLKALGRNQRSRMQSISLSGRLNPVGWDKWIRMVRRIVHANCSALET